MIQWLLELLEETLHRGPVAIVGFLAGFAAGLIVWFLFVRPLRDRSHRSEREKAESQRRSLEEQVADIKESLSHERRENERLQEDARALHRQLDDGRRRNADLVREARDCRDERDKRRAERDAAVTESEALGRQAQENRDALEAAQRELATARQNLKEAEQTIVKLGDDFTALRDEGRQREIELTSRFEELTQAMQDVQGQRDWLGERIRGVANMDGRVWQRPATGEVPPFRPPAPGRPPIVAVTNLKGGVGKTTLTANLGATFWDRGRRVLLADLDFQGSLTALCLGPKQIEDIREGRRFAQNLFGDEPADVDDLRRCLERVAGAEGRVLAADEELANAELRLLARWLLGETPDDVRYRLRELLHSEEVQQSFDLILLDCPPRWTTASINALTAADFVLVPALPDKTSTDAVPRLLAWLRKFQRRHSLAPDLRLLGVVANKVERGELKGQERDLWARLGDACRDRWGEPVHLFESVIPRRVDIARAANDNRFAAFNPRLRPFFRDLADEILARIPAHESRRAATVS